jgi:hypothetical protein
MNNTWAFKLLLAIDVFFCSIIWRDPNVTISSMTGLERRKAVTKWWALFMPLSDKHCEKAISFDIERARAALRLLSP